MSWLSKPVQPFRTSAKGRLKSSAFFCRPYLKNKGTLEAAQHIANHE
jgi:hypothetical protein